MLPAKQVKEPKLSSLRWFAAQLKERKERAGEMAASYMPWLLPEFDSLRKAPESRRRGGAASAGAIAGLHGQVGGEAQAACCPTPQAHQGDHVVAQPPCGRADERTSPASPIQRAAA